MLKTVKTHHKAHGQLFLIGADPGDPELLTTKATKAIAAATVLIVDDLVNPVELDYAKQSTKILTIARTRPQLKAA